MKHASTTAKTPTKIPICDRTGVEESLDIPCAHHEKWDGTGYPLGLKGTQIPLVARIFAVVDVWDALRSDRLYRTSWSEAKVREHIRSLAGTQFDPHVVTVCLDSDLLVDGDNSRITI